MTSFSCPTYHQFNKAKQMHIGGDLYEKLLNLLGSIEHALLSDGDNVQAIADLVVISKQFCLNHNVSFEFLRDPGASNRDKVEKMQKIFKLVMKLKAEEDARLEASAKMSKYR